jgi:hypothetical protein
MATPHGEHEDHAKPQGALPQCHGFVFRHGNFTELPPILYQLVPM